MVDLDRTQLRLKLNRFCSSAWENGIGLCLAREHGRVTVDHMLLKLVEEPKADVQLILHHFEVSPERILDTLYHNLERFKSGNPGRPTFASELPNWFERGWLIGSINLQQVKIRSGCLLLALLEDQSQYLRGGEIFGLESVDSGSLVKQFTTITATSIETADAVADAADRITGTERGSVTPTGDTALEKFCIDVTARARRGEIDPVFGRDVEIRKMTQILARRRKNNPIVVGEPGVGKTAVVEGLALKIAEGDVPEFMRDVSLLTLDLGLLQAGAGVKGEFENRLKTVIAEVKSSERPIVLFIDEAHTMIGAGGSAGGGDAANLLKPALARGELRTIAATTWMEYKKYFEKDAALSRRFEPIKLDEPSIEETVIMLRGLRSAYEKAHSVSIPDDSLVEAVELSSRYLAGRLLPDKAVDLIDTAAARVKIGITAPPASLEGMQRRIQTLRREREAHRRDLVTHGETDDERIGELDMSIEQLESEAASLNAAWQKERDAVSKYLQTRDQVLESSSDRTEPKVAATGERLKDALAELSAAQASPPLVPIEVTPEIVGKVVSDWTGIPVGKVVKDKISSTLSIEDQIKQRIKGQDYAVAAIGSGVRTERARLQDPTKPFGVYLLVGPSGVGKTEMALTVADLVFGGDRFMTSINMSEYKEAHSISNLKGSPKGYVGYGEGGVLTEAVRQKPYSLVLLDEVEKAHPEVMELFYQVFDKGILEDSDGRRIDFKNTLIFMTSNLATDMIMEFSRRESPPSHEEVASVIRPVLNHYFKPALVGRMTIVPFFPLKPDSLRGIVEMKLDKLANRLHQNHRVEFVSGDCVLDTIVKRCTEVDTGARNIDYIIQGNILPKLSREILERMIDGPLPSKLTMGVGMDGEFEFTFSD